MSYATVMPSKSPLYQLGYERLDIFYHPSSSTSKQLQPRMKQLQENQDVHGLEVFLHQTKKDPRHNAEHIAEKVGRYPESVVGVGGGDGSAKHVKQAQVDMGLFNPTMLLGGGSACDLARSLSDWQALHNLTNMVMRSQPVEVRPLDITVQHKGAVENDMAFGHFGVGALAFISQYLNHDRVRGSWLKSFHLGHLALEAATTSTGLLRSRVFPVEINNSGEIDHAYELMVSGIEREGKIMRPQASVLTEGYSFIDFADKRLRTIATMGGKLVLGKQEGADIGNGLHLYIPPTLEHPLYRHSDGEPVPVYGDSTIDIRPYPDTVTYTTTHL
jgi:diacylglycerol kinase family enzyme